MQSNMETMYTAATLLGAVLYLSAKSRQPGTELAIAETKYNSKQAPDPHLSSEAIRRIVRSKGAGDTPRLPIYNSDLHADERNYLVDRHAQYMEAIRQDTFAVEGGPREISFTDLPVTPA